MRQMRNRTMKSADLATLRSLHGRKRWEHIWAYYKLPIIGILIVLYIFGYAAYRHFTKKEAVLYVSLVNISAGSDLTGQLTDGFAQDAHLTKKQQVNLLTGLSDELTGRRAFLPAWKVTRESDWSGMKSKCRHK